MRLYTNLASAKLQKSPCPLWGRLPTCARLVIALYQAGYQPAAGWQPHLSKLGFPTTQFGQQDSFGQAAPKP